MPGLYIHTGNRLEILAETLAGLVVSPVSGVDMEKSVFTPEIVVAQSRGMARWVSLELSRINGICANVRFPFPDAFYNEIIGEILPDVDPGKDAGFKPFDKHAVCFSIMQKLPELLDRPEFISVGQYLENDESGRKRYQLSGTTADLFDQYQIFRPEMVIQWDAAAPVDKTGKTGKISSDEAWQSVLWREVITNGNWRHRAALRQLFFKKIKLLSSRSSAKNRHGLPRRVSIFGISYLPPFYMEFFTALAQVCEVHMFLMNPCREYWGTVLSEPEIHRLRRRASAKKTNTDDALYLGRENRLLASLGRMGRDFFQKIPDLEAQWMEYFKPPEGNSILHRLQSDIYDLVNREHAGTPKKGPTLPDRSVQIHACHSPMREIEVLHDQILNMLEEDVSLVPEDIMVLTPDIELYIPYIQAVFEKNTPNNLIPYTISDRGKGRLSPETDAFFALLELAGGRFTAGDVFDLLEFDAIREKFGMDMEAVSRCADWAASSGIRWGIDAAMKKKKGLPGLEDGTWRAGLRRLVLGMAMPGEEIGAWEGILPFDHVEGSDTRFLDALLTFLDALFSLPGMMEEPRPMTAWKEIFTGLISTFFNADTDRRDGISALQRAVDQTAADAGAGDFTDAVSLDTAKACVTDRLETASFGRGFLSGGVTFGAMLPMRAIPVRVVCLLGMNMDAFPRRDRPTGFNLMVRHPKSGDRSGRNDDKYQFLEALVSARDIFYLSYVGQSLTDNTDIPPSVLVGELLNILSDGFGIHQDAVVTRHRLQPFSPAYYQRRESSETACLFSYDQDNFEAAKTLLQKEEPYRFVDRPLPEPGKEWTCIDMDQLVSFLKNPARFLLEKRCGIFFRKAQSPVDDTEMFHLSGLDAFQAGESILDALKAGEDPGRLFERMRQKGRLPHHNTGTAAFDEIREAAEAVWEKAASVVSEERIAAAPFELSVGRFTLTGVRTELQKGRLIRMSTGKLTAKRLIEVWVDHLVCCATASDTHHKSSCLFTADQDRVFQPVSNPIKILHVLLECYWEGLRLPLRFFPQTSYAYAEQVIRRQSTHDVAIERARAVFSGNRYNPGEYDDPYVYRCFSHNELVRDTFFDESFAASAEAVFGPIFASGKV